MMVPLPKSQHSAAPTGCHTAPTSSAVSHDDPSDNPVCISHGDITAPQGHTPFVACEQVAAVLGSERRVPSIQSQPAVSRSRYEGMLERMSTLGHDAEAEASARLCSRPSAASSGTTELGP